MTFQERAQVLFLQIVGALVVLGVIVVAAVLGRDYPVPAALVSCLVSALIGKWIGTPIPSVTLARVGDLPPHMAAAVAARAIESLPPQQRNRLQAARVVLEGLSMPPPPPSAEGAANGDDV